PGVVRIQLEGELVFALGVVPLPLHLIQTPHQGMGSRKRWIQFQRPTDRADYFWLHFIRRSPANARHAECVISMRQAEVSRRSEEHTSELQSRLVISYAVFCL